MSETRDPAIKLFGKTIQLPEISAATESDGIPKATTEGFSSSPTCSTAENYWNKAESDEGTNKDSSETNRANLEADGGTQILGSEDIKDPTVNSVVNDLKLPSFENVNATEKLPETEEDQRETNMSQEKGLKKPDRILPCPRCNSMDTKFCYYNNYNVKQPRHFCKNCQRYWTAGGTMRNVPVGAGRRKNKNLTSHFSHVTTAGARQNARAELPNGVHHTNLKLSSTILAFSSDTPLCESMASVLNIAEKTVLASSDNDSNMPELRRPVSCEGGDDGDNHSIGSSVTAASSKDEFSKTRLQDPVIPNCREFAPQMPFFSRTPWPYPLNSAQWNSSIPPPAFGPAAFPIPIYPAYWGCTVVGTWDVPWINPPASQSLIASTSPNSPTLGKHSRDDNMPKQSDSVEEETQKKSSTDKCLWIPKTSRINDPGEAAKSSIWTTLGIKSDNADSSNGSLMKPFQSKVGEKNNASESSAVLQANPAALSRSHNFHEVS